MNNTLISLLHLSDTALPIGSYAHSAGLETYVQLGIVHDFETAKLFVEQMLEQNVRYNDAAFVSLAYDAATKNNMNELLHLDTLCNAGKMAKEIRQASNKLGMRLIKIFDSVQDNSLAFRYKAAVQAKEAWGHYSIAFGLYAHTLKLPKRDALTGFYYTTCAGFVTNCVKLVPLSQHDGQKIIFGLHTLLNDLVESTMQPDENTLGLCSAGFDIRSMQHEQLYSRLYMS